jgi:hypothetical protein
MRTGVSYMGQHDQAHLTHDVRQMQALRLDDLFLAIQENDFHYFPGKISLTPRIAADHGLRTVAIFWGALNLFGGGRSSQFLLENPAGFQTSRQGTHLAAGCYMNSLCRSRIHQMVDTIAGQGYSGYFVDEPTPLHDCFCPSCCQKYEQWYGESLHEASPGRLTEFRQRCVVDYVQAISGYCKANHPALETLCCLMPHDQAMWERISAIPTLDNFGSDLYWVNNDDDVETMAPTLRAMDNLCRKNGKTHHEWLQCWDVHRGREKRILDQGEILLREKPDALYVWAWNGQAGTAESCADPVLSWEYAKTILRTAKGLE